MKLRLKSEVGFASGGSRILPLRVAPERLASLVKMAAEKNAYLKWHERDVSAEGSLPEAVHHMSSSGAQEPLLAARRGSSLRREERFRRA